MKRKRMIAEVAKLLRAGRLNPIDADWIGRLKPESQLAAAQKCMNPDPTFTADRYDKSTIGNAPPRRGNAR